MSKARNKKDKSNNGSEKDFDILQDIDLDNQNLKDDDSDEDFINNSDISEQIEKKLDSIYEKGYLSANKFANNLYDKGEKEEKKKKEKYDKKIMYNYFKDYFDASHNKIEDYYEVNYPELSKYELKIDQYSDLYKSIDNREIFPSLLENQDKYYQDYNVIDDGNLFRLMYEILFQNFNIFLYGFGNKMKLMYDFINFYQDKRSKDSDNPFYIISCNLNNPEMSMKVIVNKVESCLRKEFEEYYENYHEKKLASETSIFAQIDKLRIIYNKNMDRFYDNPNNEKIHKEKEEDDDKYSSSDEEENNKDKNLKTDLNEFKILLIVHNIGNTLGQSKLFQENLSELVTLNFINLIATCENLTIPYYWTTEVKDKYKFCFIKFDTYGPYDLEIDENNSIKGGNNLKGGEGLKEIFSSLSETQKRLIKEIAKLNLENDYDNLTPKGLVNYFVNTGIGIVTDIQKLESLMLEAIDHEIVALKPCSVNNKDIYRITLDRSVIERIAEGEYM
jgi:hypothetical protein